MSQPKLKFFLLLISCLGIFPAFAQINDLPIQWQRSYGGSSSDVLEVIRETADGGFFVGGSSGSGASGNKTVGTYGGNDFWLLKLDSLGEKIWERNYGGTNNDYLAEAVPTGDGGFVVAGYSRSSVSGNKTTDGYGSSDYWIFKLDGNGEKLWEKTFGGGQSDLLRTLWRTADGGFLLGGTSSSAPSGNKTSAAYGESDMWLIRTDANGNKLWETSYGGGSNDFLIDLEEAANGEILLGGYTYSDISGNKTSSNSGFVDYWVLKLDQSGDKLWEKTLGGTNIDVLRVIRETDDGGVLVAGDSASGISGTKGTTNYGNYDFWVIKLDGAGEKVWEQNSGGTGDDGPEDILETAEGFVIGGSSGSGIGGNKTAAPYAGSDYWAIGINSAGVKLWDRAFGGTSTDNFKRFQGTSDGGMILAGDSYAFGGGVKRAVNYGEYDFWLVKLGNAPGISMFPTNQAVAWNTSIYRLPAVGGAPPLSYQWFFNGSPLPDATQSQLLVTNFSLTNIGNYQLVVSNSYGAITSSILQFTGQWLGPVSQWQQTHGGATGDWFESMDLAHDGGYILAGYRRPPDDLFYDDVWVVKTDDLGNKLWDKSFGGTHDDFASCVSHQSDGSMLIGANSSSPLSGTKASPGYGFADCWVLKLDADGNKMWDRSFGTTNADSLNAVMQASDGGWVLAGLSGPGVSGNKTNISYGSADAWVIKLDGNGNELWQKGFGGAYEEVFSDAQNTTDGGFILAGFSSSEISGNKTSPRHGTNGYDGWVVKLNSAGDKLWEQTFGGSSNDTFVAGQQTPDGGYIFAGNTYSSPSGTRASPHYGKADYWVVKTDSTGNQLWEQTFGGKDDDILTSLCQTRGGGYVLAGYSDSLSPSGNKTSGNYSASRDYWIVVIDKAGNKLWEQNYGSASDDTFKTIKSTPDAGFLLGGRSAGSSNGNKTSPGLGQQDFWIVKLGWPLKFDAITHGQPVKVLMSGPDYTTNVLEVSSDFATWSPLTNVILTNAVGEWIENNRDLGERFYRLRKNP